VTAVATTETGAALGRADQPGDVVRLLIVDDHDLFRTGLAMLLSAQRRIDVVGQASGGHSGVRLTHELKPDVVLMDLRMPDLDGIAATRAILDRDPGTRVVALTVASEDSDVAEVMTAGACGFLVKDAPVDDVAGAVRAAAQGASWLSPRAAEVVLSHMRGPSADAGEGRTQGEDLTPRELDVLRLLARGVENVEIATKLDISPRTAKNHVSSILKKLRVPNRIQAAICAVRNGLD
jgi:DNA-binding NarL/FixJ family response regulator